MNLIDRAHAWRWPLGIVLLTVLLATLLMVMRTPVQQGAVAETFLQVAVQHADPQPLRPSLRLYGRVETPRQAQLSSALNAYVQQVSAREGLHVKAGAPLVLLDERDVRSLVAQREADLQDANARMAAEQARHQADGAALIQEQQLLAISQRAVNRQRSLLNKKLASQSLLDEALRAHAQQALVVINRERDLSDHQNRQEQLKAARARAEAQLASAQLELERSEIKAPFSGYISEVSVAVGERLRPGDALLSLYPDDQLELRVQIPHRVVQRLREAMHSQTPPEAFVLDNGRRLPLVLDRLAAEVQQGRGGVDAFFRLSGAQERLALAVGRAVEVVAVLPPEANSIVLPPSALYGGTRIYRVVDNHLQSLEIERLGQRHSESGTEVLIRSEALQVGDAILLTRIPNAISGLSVRVAEEKQP